MRSFRWFSLFCLTSLDHLLFLFPVVSCPDPGRPENGDRFGGFTVGSTVLFSCQEPFKIHGSQKRTCMENKEWNGTLSTCQNESK